MSRRDGTRRSVNLTVSARTRRAGCRYAMRGKDNSSPRASRGARQGYRNANRSPRPARTRSSETGGKLEPRPVDVSASLARRSSFSGDGGEEGGREGGSGGFLISSRPRDSARRYDLLGRDPARDHVFRLMLEDRRVEYLSGASRRER